MGTTENKKKKTGFALNPNGINRNGRPKKENCITDALRQAVKGKERQLAEMWIERAETDLGALKDLVERLEGKPVIPHEMDGGLKIEIEYVSKDESE